MGTTQSVPEKLDYFLIERIIVTNLNDIEGNNIILGIYGNKSSDTNPLKNQGIKIGMDNTIYTLKNFI